MSSWGTRLVTIGTSFAVAAGMGYHAYKASSNVWKSVLLSVTICVVIVVLCSLQSGALERALSKLTTTGFSKMIEFVQNEQNKMQREQE